MRSLPPEKKELATEILRDFVRDLTDDQALAVLYDWSLWARPNQLAPPGDWSVWLVLAGRGFGKTRTGAEWVRAKAHAGGHARIALVAPTAGDARDTMVEGESGILAVSPPGFRPEYEPSKRRLTWPNGVRATLFSAEEPERLRGPQHHAAWCDEVASWKYPDDAWDNLQFGLRLGQHPQACVTGTPRPTRLVKELAAEARATNSISTGSTLENRANLAPKFVDRILKKYGGTRLGRQEIEAEILEDNPGALWTLQRIDELRFRMTLEDAVDVMQRVVIAVDPAVSATATSDETGIVAAGLGFDDHAYVLDDRSGIYRPAEWAGHAVSAYRALRADRIVGEVNNGGDLVEANIRTADANAAFTAVHATRGKAVRAEPISALYEQGRVHHIGVFPRLEDQMTQWDPTAGGKSPDRVDALVWALTELMLGDAPKGHQIHV